MDDLYYCFIGRSLDPSHYNEPPLEICMVPVVSSLLRYALGWVVVQQGAIAYHFVRGVNGVPGALPLPLTREQANAHFEYLLGELKVEEAKRDAEIARSHHAWWVAQGSVGLCHCADCVRERTQSTGPACPVCEQAESLCGCPRAEQPSVPGNP